MLRAPLHPPGTVKYNLVAVKRGSKPCVFGSAQRPRSTRRSRSRQSTGLRSMVALGTHEALPDRVLLPTVEVCRHVHVHSSIFTKSSSYGSGRICNVCASLPAVLNAVNADIVVRVRTDPPPVSSFATLTTQASTMPDCADRVVLLASLPATAGSAVRTSCTVPSTTVTLQEDLSWPCILTWSLRASTSKCSRNARCRRSLRVYFFGLVSSSRTYFLYSEGRGNHFSSSFETARTS